MTERPIRFFHRGRIVEVADAAPTRHLLDWLRDDAHGCGTKEGCAEGDCGACTVVLGARGADGGLQLRAVNACLQLLPMVDGLAVLTVEDLAPRQAAAGAPCLHPVQQAMVDCHGSQCGFCTPGFVMSLWACYQQHQQAGTRPTRQQLADTLAGNLCRCTGYRPILDAGRQMFDAPPQPLDPAPVLAALQQLASDRPLAYAPRPAQAWWAPHTVHDLATLAAAHPQARLVAGATDVALWVNKQLRVLPEIIHTARVADLQQLRVDDGTLHIGAAVPLEAAWAALVERWPALRELWLRFASPPVRHAGTLGGNIANGSPIGDGAPVLMALGAQLLLQRGSRQRQLPLNAFYLDYMRNALQPGEFVHSLQVPLADARRQVRAYKVSKRFDSDISAVCGAFALQLDEAGRVQQPALVFGGLAATVRHAAAAQAALAGQAWTEATLAAAQAALAQDFQPLSDHRASAAYRLQVAQNLLRRLWLETRADDPLPAQAVSVFARAEDLA